MNKMKKHDITGEAVFDNRPKSLDEKKNQAIQRKIQENQNIALVNYRLQIEKQKVDKMSRNLHLIDFANKAKAASGEVISGEIRKSTTPSSLYACLSIFVIESSSMSNVSNMSSLD